MHNLLWTEKLPARGLWSDLILAHGEHAVQNQARARVVARPVSVFIIITFKRSFTDVLMPYNVVVQNVLIEHLLESQRNGCNPRGHGEVSRTTS